MSAFRSPNVNRPKAAYLNHSSLSPSDEHTEEEEEEEEEEEDGEGEGGGESKVTGRLSENESCYGSKDFVDCSDSSNRWYSG